MTYIDYLNDFNRWLESGNLPGGSQLMYFKLLNVFNTMANLRESGAIEQDADTVTLLHNPPCETDERMESPSLLELWLDKNRRGATGHVDATFYKVTGRVTA